MDTNQDSTPERDAARLEPTLEPTSEPTSETGDETTQVAVSEPASDAVTAALPADQPRTAALPAPHPAAERHTPDTASSLSTPLADEVGYEPEPVAAAAPPLPTQATVPDDVDAARPDGPRMRTIVLGLVLLAISGTGLLRMLT